MINRKKIFIWLGVIFVLIISIATIKYFFFSYGNIEISSEYQEFTLLLDDREINIGETHRVRVGKHTILAKKEDYEDYTTTFYVANKKTSTINISFELISKDTEPDLLDDSPPDDI